MAKMNKSKNWKQNWAALLPKKYARPNRGFREKTSGAGAGSIYII
jgi:hypothetical protein